MRFFSPGRFFLRSTVVLGVLALIATWAWSLGDVAVSHTFTLTEGLIYLISPPLDSDFPTTGADLEGEIRVQTGNPSLSVEVVAFAPSQQVPTLIGYPVSGTLVDDVCLSLAECPDVQRTDTLTFGPREAIMVRVSGGSASFAWSGMDVSAPTYPLVGPGADHWLSLPYNLAPYTADELLNDIVAGDGTVTRLIPGTVPAYEFWTGTLGDNFTVGTGEGVIVRCGNSPPCTEAPDDADGDGVVDFLDLCDGTVLPEPVPTEFLRINRWADVDGDGVFDTSLPSGSVPERAFTMVDTLGCSCSQIIENLALGQGHAKFGCSISAMEEWVATAGQ